MFERPFDISPHNDYEEEEEPENEFTFDAPDLANVTLRKLVRREEFEFLKKCRETISELTGEDFTVEMPPWLTFAGMQLEADGYCENLMMAIDYVPNDVPFYELPPQLHSLYGDPYAYGEFLMHVGDAKLITNSIHGIAVIPIFGIMSDIALREYLLNKLHELTRFRVWVGSPRCKCPSMMAKE